MKKINEKATRANIEKKGNTAFKNSGNKYLLIRSHQFPNNDSQIIFPFEIR